MNKTIIININGIVFHIEEDAYEILKNYMTDVKRHFINSADSLEITTDIENRIAEMFTEVLTADNKQVIVEHDVQNIIEQMGRVEDFDEVYDDAKGPAGTADLYNNTGQRKLFRDTDDHLLGGVCSGIALYFDIPVIWVRLAFALLSISVAGAVLYIVLWAVIPKAISRADRMAMKGEKLNLQGFKNNLEEELSSVKTHLNNVHEEARPVVYKVRDFTGDLFHHLGMFFEGAGKLFIKFLGVVLLLACFAGAISLIIMLIAFVGFNQALHNHIFPFTIIGDGHANRIYVTAFITAFIPVLTLILVIISAVFNTRPIGRSTGITLLIIWVCGLSCLIFYITKTASNFRESASFTTSANLTATPGNVYHLKFNNVKYLTHDDSLRLNINEHFKNMVLNNDNDEDDNEPRNIDVSIERSDISQPVLVEKFIARGRDYESALVNARNAKYIFIQQDSVLKFDDVVRRTIGDSWHGEEVHLTLKLPLNSKVVIDRELNDRVNLNGISVRDCNSDDKKSSDLPSANYIVVNDGLQCKIDTLVVVKSKAGLDSARRASSAQTIAKLKAQIDSTKRADSIALKK